MDRKGVIAMIMTAVCIATVSGLALAGTAFIARLLADGVVDIIRDSTEKEVQPLARSQPVVVSTPALPEVFRRPDGGSLLSIFDGEGDSFQVNSGKTIVRRLVTLDDHRWLLAIVLRKARQRVVIFSPQLSAGAIRSDNIDYLIACAVARGVNVVVLTDYGLNLENGEPKASAVEGKKLIEAAGAQVVVVDKIHHKTLIGDDDLIVDGSFNWLSAVRRNNHAHQREERSKVTVGEAARGFVRQELARMTQILSTTTGGRLNEHEIGKDANGGCFGNGDHARQWLRNV